MTRLCCICAFACLSCAFKPSSLTPGSADGAPASDATLDATPPVDAADAAPDATLDPCPVPSMPLTIGQTVQGTLNGSSHYEPTCTLGTITGPENLYRLDVASTANQDLVLEVGEDDGLDSVLDVTTGCLGQPGGGTCQNSGAPGDGEVVVIPAIESGVRYVAVDSVAGTPGSYTLSAFLREVVGKGVACAPDLHDSRCDGSLVCIDKNGDGTARCEEQAAISDIGANDTPCTPAFTFQTDGVFAGSISGPSDVDVVALEPSAGSRVRVVIDDGIGGCSTDVQLELLTGNNCTSTQLVVSDDNSGPGPCPLLDFSPLDAGRHYWLRVSPAPGAHLSALAPYRMVIDFLPP